MFDISLPDGLYEDAKRIASVALSLFSRPISRWWRRKVALENFSDAFVAHPRFATDFVDYVNWHEQDEDWRKGNGLLAAATYGELLHMKYADLFVPYEAKLARFKRRGGTTRRIFLVGADLADPLRIWALQRAIVRHELLNFRREFAAFSTLRQPFATWASVAKCMECLIGQSASFWTLGSATHRECFERCTLLLWSEQRIASVFWRGAERADVWRKRQPFELPKEVLAQAERDVAAVLAVADEPLVAL